MAGKTQKKANSLKRVNKSDQILALLVGLDKKFTEKFEDVDKKFEGLDKKVEGLDIELKEFRKQNSEEHEIFRQHFIKLAGDDKRNFDKLENSIIGFKDEMLSVVDVTRKEYDETRQERLVMGAAQDRQQKEIEALRISDDGQNRLLESLDTRVTELEINKAA